MLDRAIEGLRAHFTASQVFGTPIERDGTTVIPVAWVTGGGGGGGHRDDSTEDGGGGFGGLARPAGVYEIRAGEVRWHPAVDVNLVVMAGAAVISVALLTRRR